MRNFKHKTNKPHHSSSSSVYHKAYKTGSLFALSSGRAFVEYDPNEKGIEVDYRSLHNALHGDRVKVQLISKSKNGRIKGKIVDIVERKQGRYLGAIENKGDRFFFRAQTSFPAPLFSIDMKSSVSFDAGDRVLAQWINWDEGKYPKVKIVENCRGWSETKLAYRQILLEKKFDVGFSKEVVEEAAKMRILPQDIEAEDRKDFRSIFTFTIDPVDAKDFDDALSFRSIGDDLYEVGVHIADVTHFLKPNTALDEEAYKRATSVYMPGYVEPMLPEGLSNDLCSLVPLQDRLCFAVIFQITGAGEIKRSDITKTTICSNHRFSYNAVQEILETQSGEHFPILSVVDAMAQSWRKKRIKEGSIDFASNDTTILLDANCRVDKIIVEESNRSHQLIEEFMLLANQYVARFMATKHKNIPFPSRIHDTPDDEKLKAFVGFANAKGYAISADKEKFPARLNAILSERKNSADPAFSVLQNLAIRSMAKAEYSPRSIGHYGLGFSHYAHFTSPIRRYPDVMLHRILYDALLGRSIKDEASLLARCAQCNERERAAMEAEREAKKYKFMEYMQAYVGERFSAIVTGILDRGAWAEIIDTRAEGFISIDKFNEVEPFEYIPDSFCLKGMRSGRKIELGDEINVRVSKVSLEQRKMDLEWIV